MGERILDNISYQSIIVTYNFGHAKVQKEISKIEITTPTPVIGKKLDSDTVEEGKKYIKFFLFIELKQKIIIYKQNLIVINNLNNLLRRYKKEV